MACTATLVSNVGLLALLALFAHTGRYTVDNPIRHDGVALHRSKDL